MLFDREEVMTEFQNYVKKYNQEDERIRLKIEHTYRVARLCEQIAESLSLTKEKIELAWLIGMLHDIGRFEQLKNYRTFIDSESINHAEYGVHLLFEQGMIRTFCKDSRYDALIQASIFYHNAYRLPKNLEQETKFFCDLLRDADKIDILKVSVDIPLQTIYDVSDSQMKQAVITPEVMENFFEHHAINHKLKKSPIDHIIGHISLVFELVYPISLTIVEEQGYLRQMLNFQTENATTQKQLWLLKQDMQNYIALKSL
jgi:putative nucleotidyltransferase with HDIG domain